MSLRDCVRCWNYPCTCGYAEMTAEEQKAYWEGDARKRREEEIRLTIQVREGGFYSLPQEDQDMFRRICKHEKAVLWGSFRKECPDCMCIMRIDSREYLEQVSRENPLAVVSIGEGKDGEPVVRLDTKGQDGVTRRTFP